MNSESRTICVLGGTGFVGRHLCARLAQDGHVVRVLTRFREQHRDMLVLPTVELVQGSVHDYEFLERAFEGCHAVINLVGILNEKGRDGKGFTEAHVELTRKVVRACKETGIQRLLQMSALKADAENGPSHYLRSKGQAEAVIRVEADPGLRATILQPSIIFGPEDSFINRFAGLIRIPNYFFVLPSPNSRFAPVFVEDVAEAFARALENRATWGKTLQLCGPRVISMKELIAYVARVMGVRRQIIGLGDGLSRTLARILEFVPGKPMSMDNYLSLKVHNICDANGLATLGIDATPMEAIVPAYLARRDERARLSTIRQKARY